MSAESLDERFWSKVKITDTCWIWTGARNTWGYGHLWAGGQRWVAAHRLAFEQMVGPIADGLTIDHLCRNRACVRPEHMEPVSLRTNILRSPISVFAARAAASHCIHGHPLSGDNVYVRPNGTRACRTCRRARDRARTPRLRKVG